MFNNGLQLDSQLTLAMKAVIQAEETARALSFDIDLGQAAVTEARAALLESFTPDKSRSRSRAVPSGSARSWPVGVPSIESATLNWLDMFNQGKFIVEVDTKGLEKSISSVSDIGRQATVGVIVVGQLIGTAIVMAILLQPSLSQFQGLAYLAMIAFGVTLIVSFIVLFRVFLHRATTTAEDAARAGLAADGTRGRTYTWTALESRWLLRHRSSSTGSPRAAVKPAWLALPAACAST